MSNVFARFSKPARSVVVEAQEHARELRSPTIEVEHLLLGITSRPAPDLRNMLTCNGIVPEKVHAALCGTASEEPLGEQDAAALRYIGIDLDSVRAALEATFGDGALEHALPDDAASGGRLPLGGYLTYGHIPFAPGAKHALELTLREAISRGDDRIETGHVLLGIMGAASPVTQTLLGGDEGIQALREAVLQLLDQAA